MGRSKTLLVLLAGLAAGAAAAQEDGRKLFTSVTPACALCHALKDAGATGAIGPAFDDLQPGPDQVIAALRSGIGAMPSYRGNLSDEQMRALARYVSKASGGAR